MATINPSKRVTCNYSMQQVVNAINSLPKHTESAELIFYSEAFNYFRFNTTGKKSMKDMALEIGCEKINENQTALQIEMRSTLLEGTNPMVIPSMFEYINGCITLTGKILAGKV